MMEILYTFTEAEIKKLLTDVKAGMPKEHISDIMTSRKYSGRRAVFIGERLPDDADEEAVKVASQKLAFQKFYQFCIPLFEVALRKVFPDFTEATND